MSDASISTEGIALACEILARDCNHHVNGRCYTHACMAKDGHPGRLERPVRFVGCENYRAIEALKASSPEPAAEPVCTCKPPEHRGGCPIGRQYVKAWYMRDNHTFFAIDLDADENGIVGQVSEVFHGPCGSYGTLFVRWMPADDRLEDFTLHLHDKFEGEKVREWAQKIIALPRKQPLTKAGDA